jgi:protein-tyrosine kinase
MSRIDQAMKRAAQVEASNVGTAVMPPEDRAPRADVPPEDPFVTPWGFDTTDADTFEPAMPLDEPVRARADFEVEPEADFEAADVPAPVPTASNHYFEPSVKERLVITAEDDEHPVARGLATEQYRRLAAALHHAQMEREIRSVLITSAVSGEGKTLTAANLALTLAESYKRSVLLVDADLRRPGLHQIFKVPSVSGLSSGLGEGGPPRLSVHEITPTLMLLPAGRPDSDPTKVLSSPQMRRILEEASSRFAWVIVDAPPIGLLSDASLLGRMVDTVLLVVEAGRTDFSLVRRAVDAIGRNKVLGVVMNRVSLDGRTYGDPYGKYYGAYGS